MITLLLTYVFLAAALLCFYMSCGWWGVLGCLAVVVGLRIEFQNFDYPGQMHCSCAHKNDACNLCSPKVKTR